MCIYLYIQCRCKNPKWSMYSKKFQSQLGSVWKLNVLHVAVWVFSGASASSHSPQPCICLISDFELIIGLSMHVHGCLSLCSPIIDWRPVQGGPRLSPNDSWDKLQYSYDDGPDGPSIKKKKKKMDGWRQTLRSFGSGCTRMCIYSQL